MKKNGVDTVGPTINVSDGAVTDTMKERVDNSILSSYLAYSRTLDGEHRHSIVAVASTRNSIGTYRVAHLHATGAIFVGGPWIPRRRRVRVYLRIFDYPGIRLNARVIRVSEDHPPAIEIRFIHSSESEDRIQASMLRLLEREPAEMNRMFAR